MATAETGMRMIMRFYTYAQAAEYKNRSSWSRVNERVVSCVWYDADGNEVRGYTVQMIISKQK